MSKNSDSVAIVGGISHILRGTFGELFGDNDDNSSAVIPRTSADLNRPSSPSLIVSSESVNEISRVSLQPLLKPLELFITLQDSNKI